MRRSDDHLGDDPFGLAARLLLRCGRPGFERAILATHVPDPEGRCLGCRWQTHSEPWPCAQHAIAERIAGARSPREPSPREPSPRGD